MKNIQNQLLAVLTALICSFSIQAQDRVDWEDRADSTDIPSIGAIVTFVKEGSVAESKRIKPGDYIVSVNNHYFGFGKKLPETDYSMVVISGETGLRRTIEMEPEWAGFKYQSFLYPQLAYLRGDLGVRGKWDDDLVNYLSDLFVSRESSLEKWQEIIEQGYPDDDILFDLIELHHTWQSGASLNPLLFLSRWESELNQNSDYSNFLFNQLEAFAIASNDYKLIKELYRLDPTNLRISKKSIDQYLAQDTGVNALNGRALLKYANSIRGESVLHAFLSSSMRAELKKNPKLQQKGNTKNKKRKQVKRPWFWKTKQLPLGPRYKLNEATGANVAGSFTPTNKSINDCHFRVRLRAVGRSVSNKYPASLSFAVSEFDWQTEKVTDRVGVELEAYDGITTAIFESLDLRTRSATGSAVELSSPFLIDVNGKDETKFDVQNAIPFVVDIIKLNNQVSVFINGASYGQTPIKSSKHSGFFIFKGQTSVVFEEISIWKLESAPE